MALPIKNPARMRSRLIETCSNSSPLATISSPVASTSSGPGKNCGLKKVVATTCHSKIMPMMEAT